jgi:phosphatidylglycerol:prolipoprotein diacylglycerol transferase
VPTLNDPVAFAVAGLTVRWYALFVLGGILGALALVRWLAEKRGMDGGFALDFAPIGVLLGIVGARAYYIALRWDYYRANPDEAINVRLGGLTIHGGLVLGALALAWYCRRRGERFFSWADLVVAAAPVGQAIGRWGNWANQEAFGTPTTLPWAVTIDPARRPPAYAEQATFHPTFLYEGVLNLIAAAVLIRIVLAMPGSRRWREGDALGLYLIMYGAIRLVVESVRTDSLTIGPLPAAYWFSGGFMLLGIALLLVRRTIWPAAFVPARTGDSTNA